MPEGQLFSIPVGRGRVKLSRPTKQALPKIQLSENARRVIEKRYILKDPKTSQPIETPEQMFTRVAKTIAQADSLYGASETEVAKTQKQFYDILAKLDFLPNSPTFTGAGTKLGQLAACFVLPVEDDMRSILKAQFDMGMIHKSGGGTGFSFSRLRPENDAVGSTGGISCGPIGFMKMFNDTTEQIKQGGTRRGANMGILRVDHPDIEKFIEYKSEEGTLPNFNISVAVDEKFMKAVANDSQYELINPRNGEVVKKIKAKEIFDKIIHYAWLNGEPGMIFLDRIKATNPTPELGEIEATNPCISGEALVPTESGLMKLKDIVSKYPRGGLKVAIDKRLGGSWHPISQAVRTGLRKIFRLETKHGHSLDLTANHQVMTLEGWKKLETIQPGKDKVYIQLTEGGHPVIKKITTPRPLKNLPKEFSFELGFILGWLVGDGWLSAGKNCRVGFTFSQNDKDVMTYCQKILRQWYGKEIKPIQRQNKVYHLSYHSPKLVEFFEKLGVKPVRAAWKNVPEAIFGAPREAIQGFLQGLFTADGTISFLPGKSASIRLTAKSKKLLQGVQNILLGFGIYAKIYNRHRPPRKGFPYLNVKGQKTDYLLDGQCFELAISKASVPLYLEKIDFFGKKHHQRLKFLANKKYYREQFIDQVHSITYLGKQEVYDLKEPFSHSFVANGIVVHNCGEQPLLPYESCNLGSINLSHMTKASKNGQIIDWEKLKETVKVGIHFLDNVIDVNQYPIPEIAQMTRGNRKIGLGVMGLADLFFALEIPYNSQEGLEMAAKIAKTIQEVAHRASQELVKTRGVFPNFAKSIWANPLRRLADGGKKIKMHNAATVTIAPTGTLSIIASVTSGIEPIFALIYTKTVMDGTALVEINPHFIEYAKYHGFYTEKLIEQIKKQGNLENIAEVPPEAKKIFVTASQIAPEDHVKMQATFQKYVDNAISKTINFPNSGTEENVKNAYLLAYRLGCKGITIYRDGSRQTQVLTSGEKTQMKETPVAPEKIMPRPRPPIVRGTTYKTKTAYGNLYVTINEDPSGAPFEVFAHIGKTGGFFAAKVEAISRLISLALRAGIKAEEVIDQLKGIRGPSPVWTENGLILSIPDAMAKILEQHLKKDQAVLDFKYQNNHETPLIQETKKVADLGHAPACPECHNMLEFGEGCLKCPVCGFSKCG